MKKNKNMSPLIIVGILFSSALADVSHVLSGQAHPPQHPVDVNSLSAYRKNAFQSGNPNDFWWMASNSPLKEAYDYFKKCSSKGNCLPPINVIPGVKVAEAHFDPIDLKKNPFLNGEFQAGAVTSSSSFSATSSGCSACSSGANSGGIAAFHTGTKIDITNNPFLSGQIATAGNGDKIKTENGFLGVQPRKPEFATSHPLSNKKPFATAPPVFPQSFVLGGEAKGLQCKGQGYLCVAKSLCVNGVLNKTEELHQIRNEVQYCNADTEVCCQLGNTPTNVALSSISGKTSLASNINDLVDITAGKSSVTGSSFKFSGGAGSSPGQIQVIVEQLDGVKPQIYSNGESGAQTSASTNKATRDVTPSAASVFPSTIDYSNVQISNDIRFASTINGPAYLPPVVGPPRPSTTPELVTPTKPTIITYQPSVPTTPRPVTTTGFACPPGTILTLSGICETPSVPVPSCPVGTIRTPNGDCERPVISTTLTPCPFGTILTPDGNCARPTPLPSPTPSPSPSPRPCPPGTFLRPSGLCESPNPACPFGTIQRPDGTCGKYAPTPKVCPYGALPDGSCITPSSPPPNPRPCPAGTFLTAYGICETPRPVTTPRPCPPGTVLTPSGLCEALKTPIPRPVCPLGTIQRPSGICEQPIPVTSPTTPGYEYSPSPCPPGTFKAPSGLCETLTVTTARPQCPPGTYLTPFGSCETPRPSTPKPPPRPFEPTASRDYLPPVTPTQYVPSVTQKPYQPSITTEKPFVTQKPPVTPLSPFKPSITPSKPFQPYVTPQIPIETTLKPSYPQITTPRPSHPSVTTQRPYQSSSPKPYPFLTTKKDFTSPPVCSLGQVPSATGYGCVYPSSTPRPSYSQGTTPRPPQPSITTLKPYQPSSPSPSPFLTTQKVFTTSQGCSEGQVPSPTGYGCIYTSSTPRPPYSKGTTPRPSQPSVTTLRPYQPSTQKDITFSSICSNGQVPSPIGYRCVYPTTPKAGTCLPGQTLSPTGTCIYPVPQRPSSSKPSCAFGQVLSSSGACIYTSTSTPSNYTPSRQPYCGFGQILSPSGTCIYPSKSTPIPDQVTSRPICPPGQTLSPSGDCKYSPSKSTSLSCSPEQRLSSSGLCEYVTTTEGYTYPQPTTLRPKPSCKPGQVPSLTGYGCVYPSSSSTVRPFTSTPGYDYPKPTTPFCRPGQILSPIGSCIDPTGTTKPFCSSGQVPSPSGLGCEYPKTTKPGAPLCGSGQILSTTGSCTYQTTPGRPFSPTPSCAPGQIPSPSGIGCEYPRSPKPGAPQCGAGKILSSMGLCIYPTGTTPRQPGPRPSCGPGQVPSPLGISCEYPITSKPEAPQCGPGQILSQTGSCIYPTGTTPQQPISPKPSCGPGQVPSLSGIGCEYPRTPKPGAPQCGLGQVLSATGFCIYSTVTTPGQPIGPKPSCGLGQIPSPSGIGCEYPRTPKPGAPLCGPGQKLSPTGSCIYPIDTTPGLPIASKPSCGPGQVPRSSGIGCEYPRTPKPGAPLCGPGQILSQTGSCIYPTGTTPQQPISPKPSCGPGQIPSLSGIGCEYPRTPKPGAPQCGLGQVLSATGSCIYPTGTTPGQPIGPKPSCGPGKIPSPSGIGCDYPKTPKPTFPSLVTKPSCPFGTKLSPVTNECLTTLTTVSPILNPSSTLQPSCGPGQIISPSGICIYPSRPLTSCPTGQIISLSGSCVYPSDTTTIIPPTIRPICRPGQIASSGTCVYPSQTTPTSQQKCGSGQILSSSGFCIPETAGPRPKPTPSCPFGSKLSPITNECITRPPKRPTGYDYPKPSTPFISGSSTTPRPVRPKQCLPGQILSSSGSCVYSSKTTSFPTPSCGPGQIVSPSGICTYPSPIPSPTPPSYRPSSPGIPTQSTEQVSCRPGQILSDSGICIYIGQTTSNPRCEGGQVLSASGSCVYSSSSTSRPFPSVTTGYDYTQSITTFKPSYSFGTTTSRPKPKCSPGQVLSPSGFCIYSSSQTDRPQPGSKTSCKPGQRLSQSGTCFYPSRPTSRPSCGTGQVLSSNGSCIYSFQPTFPAFPTTTIGYDYSRPTTSFAPSYTTVRPSTVRECGSGQILSSSGACIYQTSRPEPTPKPSCGSGQVLSPSGSCIYTTGSTPRPIPTVSTGYVYPGSSTPSYSSQTTIRPITGKQCGPNQILSSSGTCIYTPGETTRPYINPKPSCRPGQELSESGVCFYPSKTSTKPECVPGQVLSSFGSCVYSPRPTSQPPIPTTTTSYTYADCAPGQILTESGECISQTTRPRPGAKPSCRTGQVLSPSGTCFYPSRPSCGHGQVLSANGSCVYSFQPTSPAFPTTTAGYEYSRPTTPGYTTARPSTVRQCGPGQILSSYGACIYQTTRPETSLKPSCRPGQELSEFGTCVYPSKSSPKPSCGPGQALSSSGSCIYPLQPTPQPFPTAATGYTYPKPSRPFETGTTVRPNVTRQCGSGQILLPSGFCVYASSTPKPSSKPLCAPGQELSESGTCIYPLKPSPTKPFIPGYSDQTTIRPTTITECGPGQILSLGICIYQTTRPQTAPKPSCGLGQILSSSGLCTYPLQPGTTITPTTGYEYSRPSTSLIPGYTGPITLSPPRGRQCGIGQILSPSGTCVYPPGPTPTPYPSVTCGPDQILLPSGACVYSSSTTVKHPPGIKPSCGPGQIISTTGTCIYPGPTPTPYPSVTCGPNQVLAPSGACVYSSSPTVKPPPGVKPSCGPGQIPSSFGTCIYPSEPTPTPYPSTTCGPNQILTPSGVCVYSSGPTVKPPPGVKPSCGPGQIPSSSGSCIYPPGSTPTPYPSTTCGPNQVLTPSGACVYSSSPTAKPPPGVKPSCGPGQILSASGTCIYPLGPTPTPYPSTTCRPNQVLTPSGACVYSSGPTAKPPPGVKPSCGPGQILSASGTCIYPPRPTPTPYPSTTCEPYQVLTPSGACVYSSSPTENPPPSVKPSCGFGQILSSSGTCIYPTTTPYPLITCGPNQVLSSSGTCVYSSRSTVRPSSEIKPSCGPGQVLSPSGICIYPAIPTTTSSPSRTCGPNQVLSPSGACVYSPRPTVRPPPDIKPSCGPGQELSPAGICIYPSTPKLICRPGQTLSPSGTCIPSTPSFPETTIHPKQCPPGSKPSAFGSGCEYPRPTTPRPTIETVTGYKYPKPDKPFVQKPICPPGQRLGPSGFCESQPVLTTTPRYDFTSEPTVSQPCPPGSKLTHSGTCQFTPGQPSPPIRPDLSGTCPIGTIKLPSGLCESTSSPTVKCPFGTRLSATGSCDSTSGTFRPPIGPGKSCPPGTIKTNSGSCERPSSPIPPSQGPISCPSGSSLSPSGICQYPSPTPFPGRPTDTNNRITPSYPTKKPYRPSSPPTAGYYYETPTPTFGYPSSTLIPNSNIINNQYVPAPTTPQYLPPPDTTGSTIKGNILPPPSDRPDNKGEPGNTINVSIPPSRPPPFKPEQNNEPPIGCAAALKCVQEIYCTAEGVVSPVPVVLTKDQELLRVPTTECKDEDTGIIGKCCRDPNYKDPWPSANLVNGVDNGQYKEDNFYGQRQGILTNRLIRSSNVTRTARGNPDSSQTSCGERHKNTKPPGPGPIDANFAEYPWQAMILRDSNRSLLCGGAIIRKNAVLTAAHCVEGLDTSDVLIKGGEWKLGIDEEPLPFQIVKVGAILRHPEYVPGSYKNDLAILVLRENLRPSKNVGTICLPETKQISTANCVATGWGKRILQLHAKGAIMHHINVNVLDSQQCQQTLQQNFQSSVENVGPSTLCGVSDIDQCRVDYGSALACANNDGHYTLTGIYAWDTGCKEENQIGGYVTPDVEWIESTLAKSIKELKKIEREYLLKTRT